MKLTPLGNRVLIEEVKTESKTSSGILIKSSQEDKTNYAIVVAVSKDVQAKDILKVGDKVIFSNYVGKTVKDGNKESILIELDDILAIVEGE